MADGHRGSTTAAVSRVGQGRVAFAGRHRAPAAQECRRASNKSLNEEEKGRMAIHFHIPCGWLDGTWCAEQVANGRRPTGVGDQSCNGLGSKKRSGGEGQGSDG